jgi:hypothetical protein
MTHSHPTKEAEKNDLFDLMMEENPNLKADFEVAKTTEKANQKAYKKAYMKAYYLRRKKEAKG